MSETPFSPDAIHSYKTVTDVNGEAVDLGLHTFQPKDSGPAPRPAIIYFFGGGWRKGQPQAFYANAAHFATHGFVGISADYRTEERHGTSPFACVQDGRSALRWLKSHAAALKIDPTRIIAAGSSAGGHVAACTVLPPSTVIDDPADDGSIQPNPAAMVLLNPVTDTVNRAAERIPGDSKTISPLHHITAGLPPTLVLHSRDDELIPYATAQAYVEAMVAAGNHAELETYTGYGHGFHYYGDGNNPAYGATIARTEAFLQGCGFM